MLVVCQAAAPALANSNIGGYGSRLALRLAGTTKILSWARPILSRKIVRQFIQRFAAGLLGGPVRTMAGACNLDAHGFPPAPDLPKEGSGPTPAGADGDVWSEV